jgi:hypothetical protein
MMDDTTWKGLQLKARPFAVTFLVPTVVAPEGPE